MDTATTATPTPTIHVTARSEWPHLPREGVATGTVDLSALVTLRGATPPAQQQIEAAPPVTLILVLDVSGSMNEVVAVAESGEGTDDRSQNLNTKLTMAKRVIGALAKRMRPVDKLGLLTFSDTVKEVLMPPVVLDDTHRDRVETVLDHIRAHGETNLCEAARRGLMADPKATAVILFTDGDATSGVTKTNDILKAMSLCLSAPKEAPTALVPLHTFGFGPSHKADVLRRMAESRHGLYVFMRSQDDMLRAFADIVGGLYTLVAHNVRVTLSPGPGVTLVDVHTPYPVTTPANAPGKRVVTIPDLQAGEVRDLLIDLTLDVPNAVAACHANGSDFVMGLLHAQVDAFSALTLTDERVAEILLVPWSSTPHDDPSAYAIDPEVSRQRNRVVAAQALKKAAQLADDDAYTEAQRVLREARWFLARSTTRLDPLVVFMMNDLKERHDQLEGTGASREATKSMMHATAMAEAHQRSAGLSQQWESEMESASNVALPDGDDDDIGSTPQPRAGQILYKGMVGSLHEQDSV